MSFLHPTPRSGSICDISDQMREVDRLMVEEFWIELIQMMENAGRALAEHTRRWLEGDARGRRVVVLAGRGGNGGGGLAAARRLSIWGADVTVIVGQGAANLDPMPARQLAIVERLGVPVLSADTALPAGLNRAEVILDALIGYSLRGAPREPIATLIRAANAAANPIIALDIPSGLGGTAGRRKRPPCGRPLP
jgi:NAD(P)H-hydrate epimerase